MRSLGDFASANELTAGCTGNIQCYLIIINTNRACIVCIIPPMCSDFHFIHAISKSVVALSFMIISSEITIAKKTRDLASDDSI